MPDVDPIQRAMRIFERRVGRRVGAIATLGGVAGAGLWGAARFLELTSTPYTQVTLAFAAGLVLGPIADRVSRRLARGRMQRALAAEASIESDAPLDLRRRLRAETMATEEESKSLAWPLARIAVLAVVSWLWLFGAVLGDDFLDMVGKALSYLMVHAGPALALFGYAAYRQGKVLAEPLTSKKRSAVTAAAMGGAMVLPALISPLGFLAGLAASALGFGLAGALVMVPVSWWMRQRTRRERIALSQVALPPTAADSEDVRVLLRSTFEWRDGPPELRARALRELAKRVGAEGIGEDLHRALAEDVEALRITALELVRELRHRLPLTALLEVERSATPAQARLLPALLHRHRGDEVEAALLRLLDHDDAEVASAAAESLGLVGSIETVERIEAAVKRHAKIWEVCSEAIQRIRIRSGGAPGRLSLVAEDELVGALSSTADHALSITDP
ncbi:MAG: hypothetical protein RMA76_39095 [Deltaproteobacteria bacterium]